ncbi:MAG: hypothetical protein ACI37Z_09635 [Candidatus Gastranaerophilaceae bacterium]
MKKILLITIFLFVVIAGFAKGKAPETDLLKAFFKNNSTIELANKFSSDINVIFEADDEISAEDMKIEFEKEVEKFLPVKKDFSKLFEDYKLCNLNFLSSDTQKFLLKKDFKTVETKAFEDLYNPFTVMFLPLEDDPYLLFSDFVKSLADNQYFYKKEYGGKYYSVLNLKVKSSGVSNSSTVQKIVELQNEFSNESQKVYLTGSPVHSYFTSLRAEKEINFTAILSALFVLALSFYYFKTLKVLLPIVVSILFGVLFGWATSILIFGQIHILTIVFSTTLIGICVDYSLHYFVEKDFEKLKKNLTISLVTTILAFLALLFSDIILLRQISVFTIFGLVAVYFIVLNFYGDLNFAGREKFFEVNFSEKIKKVICSAFVIFIVFGMFRLNFSDDVKSMYKPSNTLLAAERLNNELKISKETNFILTNANSVQNLLEQEEKIRQQFPKNYVLALSNFIPSEKMQKQNFELIKNFYREKLVNVDYLTDFDKRKLLTKKQTKFVYPDFEKYDFLKIFSVNNHSTVMIVNGEIPQSINLFGAKTFNSAEKISERLKDNRNKSFKVIVIGLFLLLPYLFFNYRKKALIVLLPSVVGMLTSLSALGVSNIPVNIFHIFGMFLVLGFTLDYSIFRIGGIQKSKDAVLISCLTTAFSFFLLSLTSFKLIASLGFVLAVGIVTAYLFSIVLIKGEKF